MIRLTSNGAVRAALMSAVLGMFGGCALSAIDRQARQLLLEKLGSTSFTMFPAFVRAEQNSYDESAAAAVGEVLTGNGFGEVTVSSEHVPITGPWRPNQAKMLQESAAAFAAYLRDNPVETEYAVLPEYLILGGGGVGGIHCYIVDRENRLAFVVLLNSHWEVFAEMNPQTIDDCTAVLIEALRGDLSADRSGE